MNDKQPRLATTPAVQLAASLSDAAALMSILLLQQRQLYNELTGNAVTRTAGSSLGTAHAHAPVHVEWVLQLLTECTNLGPLLQQLPPQAGNLAPHMGKGTQAAAVTPPCATPRQT